MKLRSYKIIVYLTLILLLAFFMRFYNFYDFQYFSGDEEIFHAILRRIVVEGKPILVIPSAQVGSSIGAFFHLIASSVFFITGSNPLLVPIFASILGVITTVVMYLVGNLIAGRKMGLISATLYAGSFLVSLFDRRLWPLTPDPLLILLGIGATIQIIRQKYRYAILFAVAISFAWQADPTNAVILLGGVIAFVLFRVPLWKKEYVFALIYLFFSILPLIVFEIKHRGTIFRPFFIHFLSRSGQIQTIQSSNTPPQFIFIWENLSRSLFLAPSKFIEQYFCYCSQYPQIPFSPISELLVIFFIAVTVIWIILRKNDTLTKNSLVIVIIYLLAFVIGIVSYSLILKYAVYQHYFVIAFAPFLLLVAFALEKISETRWALFAWIFLVIFLLTNISVLLNSKMKYPVWQKIKLVEKLSPYIGDSPFSVYGYGSKYMTDGGWTTFFIWKNKHPSRSYLNGGWDWIYRSHSLYTTNPDQGEGKKVIIFHDIFEDPLKESSSRIEAEISEGNMAATVLNNSDLWFNNEKYE